VGNPPGSSNVEKYKRWNMPEDRNITIFFHLSSGPCERVPLTHGELTDALSAIQRVFYISDGLYTRAEIYRGDELVETVQNPEYVRVESLLVQ
jgi:hypothetical protein